MKSFATLSLLAAATLPVAARAGSLSDPVVEPVLVAEDAAATSSGGAALPLVVMTLVSLLIAADN